LRRFVAYAVAVGLAVVALAVPAAADVPAERGLLDPVNAPLPAEATVWSPDGVFEQGRQEHGFRYRVQTDEPSWSIELFLVDPRGRQIGFSNHRAESDPASGRGTFRFWSQSTVPGKFTIRAKLTWGDYDRAEKWLAPQTFRLRRR
jgi:hypothetical protein